jgi:hypothetical protein
VGEDDVGEHVKRVVDVVVEDVVHDCVAVDMIQGEMVVVSVVEGTEDDNVWVDVDVVIVDVEMDVHVEVDEMIVDVDVDVDVEVVRACIRRNARRATSFRI